MKFSSILILGLLGAGFAMEGLERKERAGGDMSGTRVWPQLKGEL
jgi:hypothetical protein